MRNVLSTLWWLFIPAAVLVAVALLLACAWVFAEDCRTR